MMRRGALFVVAALLPIGALAEAASDQSALDGPIGNQAARSAVVILARPLFSPSRRPAPSVLAIAAEPARPALPRLAGLFSGPFGTRAVFSLDGKTVVAAPSEHVGAWTVTVIATRSATLASADDEQTLYIAFASSALAGTESTELPFWSNPCGRDAAAVSTVVPRDGMCQRL